MRGGLVYLHYTRLDLNGHIRRTFVLLTMHTRAQSHLLSSLRSILRHVRREWALSSPPPPGAAPFPSYVLRRFREGAAAKDRAHVKLLRAQAADFSAYLDAAAEHKVRSPSPAPALLARTPPFTHHA